MRTSEHNLAPARWTFLLNSHDELLREKTIETEDTILASTPHNGAAPFIISNVRIVILNKLFHHTTATPNQLSITFKSLHERYKNLKTSGHLNLGYEGRRGFDETVNGFHTSLHLGHRSRLDNHALAHRMAKKCQGWKGANTHLSRWLACKC